MVPDLAVIPIVENVDFIDASEDQDAQLLEKLGYNRLSIPEFISDILIPNLASQPDWLIDPLMRLIFDHAHINEDWLEPLKNVEFVDVEARGGNSGSCRLKPSEVIHEKSRIAKLFFDDESVFGKGIYAADGPYHQHLRILGRKERFDSEIAENRIKKYSELQCEFLWREELFGKCALLLEFLQDKEAAVEFKSTWRDEIQLPAALNDNPFAVLPISNCRAESQKALVEGVLGIVTIPVTDSLQEMFGWNEILDPQVIGKRINYLVSNSSS